MSTPALITHFYQRIWNTGDAKALPELLSADFAFRGSLGAQMRGHAAFWAYVCGVRKALGHYRCEVLECVTERPHAFARMRFSGIHVGEFRGFTPTGLPVHWEGAAHFRFEAGRIRELWVLGDLAGLEALLKSNARTDAESRARPRPSDERPALQPLQTGLAQGDRRRAAK